MKYFVEQATRLKGQSDAVSVEVKTSKREAKMLFHQVMAAAYANNDLDYAMAQVTNEYGANEALEVWMEEPEEA